MICLLIVLVTTALTTTNFKSTYTHVSATIDSQTTVPQATYLSTLPNTKSSWNSSTNATNKMTSLIYSSQLTTEQSATIRKPTKQSTSQIQYTTQDSETRSKTTSKSTSQTSMPQSSTTITTNTNSATSHQGKRKPHYVKS